MQRIQRSALVGLVMVSLMGGAHATDGLTATEVKIGMVNVQTGPASGLGKGMRYGAEAVFKAVNGKGGVHGRKINMVVGDNGYEPDKAIDETLKMIEQQKVFSLFGYVGTPTANAVLPIVMEMDVPLVGTYAPLSAFIKEARGAGLKAQLATVSFVGTDNLVSEVGKDGDGVVISQVVPFPDDNDLPIQRECREAVLAHGSERLGFVNFEGCITAKVMVAALERAGKEPGRGELVSALNGMQGYDLGGLKLAFAAGNHQALSDVFLTQIQNGKIAKIR